MKFSIRDMLLATFVVALAALLWNLNLTILQLKNQLNYSEVTLRNDRQSVDDLKSHRLAYQASMDRFDMIASTVVQLEKSFPELQARYSEIKPVNDQTISIRSVPMLFDNRLQSRLNRTRIYIPPQHPVALEFGVVRSSSYSNSESTKGPYRYIAYERLSMAGPYQQVLSEGFHNIDWDLTTQGNGEKGKTRVRIFLDDRQIFESTWAFVQNEGGVFLQFGRLQPFDQNAGSISRSTEQQLNFGKGESLPFLVRVQFSNAQKTDGDSEEFLQISLTNTPRDFLPFPPASEEGRP